ncbi:17.9 kDa heat shock protein 2-like [Phragmites australis]|uniref:17.9 kDa heat shock protein 2-like n=1 Tax=Phragmites australis TaxID=29695 RepID=UPI002D773C42|nr:17.9 kDa heat shock protein 2-like [Phragmites australis]
MSLVRLFDTLALDTWNPFSIFGTAVAADAWLASDTSAFANTYIESRDTAGAYVFSAALPPGVKKEEVKVEVDEGNVLVITGERSVRREERSDKWHHIERSCATFLGRFHLPEDAAVDDVRAAMDGGMLTVTVPKVSAADKPEARAIEAGPC